MSLINKMLRDLDERHASDLEKEGIARHVRTLPPPQRSLPWRAGLLTLAGGVVGALVVWLLLGTRHEPAPPAARSPSPASAPQQPSMSAQPLLPGLDQIKDHTRVELPVQIQKKTEKKAAAATTESSTEDGGLKLDRTMYSDNRPSTNSTATLRPPPAEDGEARIEKQPRAPVISEAAEAEYRKGMNAIKRGATQEAMVALGNALRIDGRHLLARQALLSLYVDQKQWDGAISIGKEGLAADPKQIGWAMLVGRLQFEQGQPDMAMETLSHHVKYAERNGEYLAFYALLLQKSKNYTEAIERYRMALALRPNEGRWWYGLGLALEGAQRSDEARQSFRQARATGNLPADLAGAVEQKLHP